jgi:citrate lyase beta subunit
MRHFSHLSDDERNSLFHSPPGEVTADAPREVLGLALGATLYTPADKPDLADAITKQVAAGVVSMVVDLEDAVPDDAVEHARLNMVSALRAVAQRPATQRPFLFARVRTPAQIWQIVAALGEHTHVLTGFVLPKFDETLGAVFLDTLTDASQQTGARFFAMPVLETREVIYRETRLDTLVNLKRLLDKHRDRILAVRIGATDLCGLYGIRRDPDLTIYDLRIIGDVIADIVNVMGRPDDTGFLVTSPVWEYFSDHERIFKPQLRATPFEKQDQWRLRQRLVTHDLDGLIREVVLDKANGLSGKTVIHPSHVAAVHALSVVTHEEYSDAWDILYADQNGGVRASGYRNKMNELKPHRVWAERTVRRACVFGVAHQDTSLVDLLSVAIR